MTDAVILENILGGDNIAKSEGDDKTAQLGKVVKLPPKNAQKKVPKPEHFVPRGQPKCGRFWKTPKTKASSIIKTRGLRRANTFEKKQKLRAELKEIKEKSRSIIAKRRKDKEDKKERRRDNMRRAEENRKKSEIVQVIRNPAKIKRMRKKQLRQIEKRDTTNM